MAARGNPSKRRGRFTDVSTLANGILDPALKKRGFASRDILAHWQIIAPAPYNLVSVPDRLKWRRNEAGADGALLFLRCHEAHRMALMHDGPAIVGAVNRYFGYVLVDKIKLSAAPFVTTPDTNTIKSRKLNAQTQAKLESKIADVQDDGVKEALRKLGAGVLGPRD